MLNPDLVTAPFSLQEALNAGLRPQDLRRTAWVRMASRLYRWRYQNADPWGVLQAWHRMLPDDAVFAGPTACWMQGLDVDPIRPVHVIVPSGLQRSRFGLTVRRCALPTAEVATVRGLRLTTLHRSLRDVCLRFEPREALVLLDMSLFLQKTDQDALDRYVHHVRGQHGTRRMRWLVEHAAPAESPMESRLRWILLEAKLPRLEVQSNLFDDSGRFVGRADIYFPDYRLVVEYDGGNHRDRIPSDDRRQNLLINAGFRVLRFTAVDVYGPPAAVVAVVRNAFGEKNRFSAPRRDTFVGKSRVLA